MKEQPQEESPEARAILDRGTAATQAAGEALGKFRRGEITSQQFNAASKELDASNKALNKLVKGMRANARKPTPQRD